MLAVSSLITIILFLHYHWDCIRPGIQSKCLIVIFVTGWYQTWQYMIPIMKKAMLLIFSDKICVNFLPAWADLDLTMMELVGSFWVILPCQHANQLYWHRGLGLMNIHCSHGFYIWIYIVNHTLNIYTYVFQSFSASFVLNVFFFCFEHIVH